MILRTATAAFATVLALGAFVLPAATPAPAEAGPRLCTGGYHCIGVRHDKRADRIVRRYDSGEGLELAQVRREERKDRRWERRDDRTDRRDDRGLRRDDRDYRRDDRTERRDDRGLRRDDRAERRDDRDYRRDDRQERREERRDD